MLVVNGENHCVEAKVIKRWKDDGPFIQHVIAFVEGGIPFTLASRLCEIRVGERPHLKSGWKRLWRN